MRHLIPLLLITSSALAIELPATSASLDPEDEQSALFEGTTTA